MNLDMFLKLPFSSLSCETEAGRTPWKASCGTWRKSLAQRKAEGGVELNVLPLVLTKN